MSKATKTLAIEQLRQRAWLGDGVLELFVRQWVLNQGQGLDAELKKRFTCNDFLACFGPPTEIEARIGVIYQQEGLQAAFDWIERELLPRFLKQELKRRSRRQQG